jgi:hypothetical protein
MKNKTGTFIGFAFGMAGFLFLFKILFLVNIPPEDEVPPGVVMFVAVLSGFLFAYLGHVLQGFLEKKKINQS